MLNFPKWFKTALKLKGYTYRSFATAARNAGWAIIYTQVAKLANGQRHVKLSEFLVICDLLNENPLAHLQTLVEHQS